MSNNVNIKNNTETSLNSQNSQNNKNIADKELANINNESFKKQMENIYNKISEKSKKYDLSDYAKLNNENSGNTLKDIDFKLLVPSYLKDVYNWAYLNPRNVELLDRNIVVHILLFLNASKLIKSYLSEVPKGSYMLQIAHVYGDMIPRLAQKIGSNGQLDLIDIAPVQLAHAYRKLKNFNHVDIWQQDAVTTYHRDYDIVGSFFLLHEVPMKNKIAIVNNMLKQVEKNNAKAVFIDYHKPIGIHPLKPIIKLVNTFLEPFANELWEYDIQSLAKEPNKFKWNKTTYFGKMYQKVVVTKL